MKYRESDVVQIETTYNVFRDCVLTALERDTGAFDIVDEILRILSIRINKRNNARTWAKNFNGTTTLQKHVLRVSGRN